MRGAIMSDPAQQFIADINREAQERRDRIAGLSAYEKAKMILDIATQADKKTDIRANVAELAYSVVDDLAELKKIVEEAS